MLLSAAALLLFSLRSVVADSGDDFTTYVTLPGVRAMKFDITWHDREPAAPGYWFVAPYGQIDPEALTTQYKPCQVGPYIYDQDGMLVWAGSCLFDNLNVFDFKAVTTIDDKSHVSMIRQRSPGNPSDKGEANILNEHLEPEYIIPVTNDLSAFNMHEFNVLPGGKTAMANLYRPVYVDLGDLGRPDEFGWITTGGFVELDINTGEVLFEWSSLGHIPIHESVKVNAWDGAADKPGWDYIHVNAIDKNAAGDYLLSCRFTNTIYLISGKDGHIIWRLGGKYSDFVQDFTFSKQHHVRFVESNEKRTVISVLNNASDEAEAEESVSSALYIEVNAHANPKTAKVIKRINRPDKQLTRLRGSVQALPNGNTFVGWSQWGYQTEHGPDGKLLMEAKFVSERFSSYRSYKYPFTGRPKTPPDVVANVYGTDKTDLTTIFHVSWNGATDVDTWNFYARTSRKGEPTLIGNTTKTDFETMYIADGYLDWVSVEAVDKDGNVLGKSESQQVITPQNWKLAGFQGAGRPSPDDPAKLYAQVNSTEETGATGNTVIDAGSDKTEDVSHDVTSDMSTNDGMSMSMDEDEDEDQDPKDVAQAVLKAYEVIRAVGGLLIFILATCSVGGLLAGIYWYFRRRRMQAYHEVPSEENQEGTPLRETQPN